MAKIFVRNLIRYSQLCSLTVLQLAFITTFWATPALAAPTKQKCAEVLSRAHWGDSFDLLSIKNGEFKPSPTANIKYFENSSSAVQITFANGSKLTIEKDGGVPKRLVTSNSIVRLNDDCNLIEHIVDQRNRLFDRVLCLRIARDEVTKSTTAEEALKCARMQIAADRLVSQRNQELQEIQKINQNVGATSISPGSSLGHVLSCAMQFNFEARKDGVLQHSADYFSERWLNSSFKAALATEQAETTGPASPSRTTK